MTVALYFVIMAFLIGSFVQMTLRERQKHRDVEQLEEGLHEVSTALENLQNTFKELKDEARELRPSLEVKDSNSTDDLTV